jgi:hypothetical protein
MRKLDWTSALQEKIQFFEKEPFVWGSHDCFTFAADCVLAMTGEDRMSKHRGAYKTELGANRKLKRLGGVAAAVSTELGKPIDPKFAQRGDVVCFPALMGDTMGICLGGVIASPMLTGVGYTPMSLAAQAWRI